MQEGARVIPAGADVYAQLVESKFLRDSSVRPPKLSCGIDHFQWPMMTKLMLYQKSSPLCVPDHSCVKSALYSSALHVYACPCMHPCGSVCREAHHLFCYGLERQGRNAICGQARRSECLEHTLSCVKNCCLLRADVCLGILLEHAPQI